MVHCRIKREILPWSRTELSGVQGNPLKLTQLARVVTRVREALKLDILHATSHQFVLYFT